MGIPGDGHLIIGDVFWEMYSGRCIQGDVFRLFIQMYSYGVYTEIHMYSDDQMVGASYHWNRPVFPLQKAFCDALVGRDAVWAMSTLPSLFLHSFLVVGVMDVSSTQDLDGFCTVGRCMLNLDLALVSVCFKCLPLVPQAGPFIVLHMLRLITLCIPSWGQLF